MKRLFPRSNRLFPLKILGSFDTVYKSQFCSEEPMFAARLVYPQIQIHTKTPMTSVVTKALPLLLTLHLIRINLMHFQGSKHRAVTDALGFF